LSYQAYSTPYLALVVEQPCHGEDDKLVKDVSEHLAVAAVEQPRPQLLTVILDRVINAVGHQIVAGIPGWGVRLSVGVGLFCVSWGSFTQIHRALLTCTPEVKSWDTTPRRSSTTILPSSSEPSLDSSVKPSATSCSSMLSTSAPGSFVVSSSKSCRQHSTHRALLFTCSIAGGGGRGEEAGEEGGGKGRGGGGGGGGGGGRGGENGRRKQRRVCVLVSRRRLSISTCAPPVGWVSAVVGSAVTVSLQSLYPRLMRCRLRLGVGLSAPLLVLSCLLRVAVCACDGIMCILYVCPSDHSRTHVRTHPRTSI
jgi:hypothetical protein